MSERDRAELETLQADLERVTRDAKQLMEQLYAAYASRRDYAKPTCSTLLQIKRHEETRDDSNGRFANAIAFVRKMRLTTWYL